MRRAFSLLPGFTLLALIACGPTNTNIRPPPPTLLAGAPIADPPPSRVVVHATIFRDAIAQQLESATPLAGEGDAEVIAGRKLHYSWKRQPFQLRFDRGRILLSIDAVGTANFLGAREFPVSISIAGEPIVTADFKALMQSTEVEVQAHGLVEPINDALEEKLETLLVETLDAFRMDVRPLLGALFDRVVKPLEIPIGAGLTACANLRIAALEAGPTVLADGVEKDLGIVILPSITLPCAPVSPSPLPLLQNVADVPAGPFRVIIPIAARYQELGRAIDKAIAGKLYFSKDYPHLYIEKPEVYPSDDQVVLKVAIGGYTTLIGIDTNLSGELFFAGHPQVIDNQISMPDLAITTGTADELLKLKLTFDHDAIREQAQAALRVDVSERLDAIKDKLSKEITFDDDSGCVRAEALRTEVTSVHAHQTFLRLVVQVDAQAALYMPCRK